MIGRISLLALLTVVATTSDASACMGCNATAFAVLPGGGLVAEWAGPAMIVLAAFLKRPFVSMAGIGSQPLWRSIQATFLSSLATTAAGVVWLTLLFSAGPAGLLLILPLPLLGALVDWAWLARVGMGATKPVSYGWLATGNYLTAIAIFTLPIWMSAFGFNTGSHLWWARTTAPTVGMISTLGVFLLVVAAFVLAPRDRNAPALYRSGRAFEVIMPGAEADTAQIEDAVMASPPPAPRSS
jgi:hypothetical protein